MRGKYIIIEGGDGAGKTTQMEMLKDHLLSKGFPIAQENVREPGGTVEGEGIRQYLLDDEYSEYRTPNSQVLGYNFARAILMSKISRLLCNGEIVICDRSWLSTIAYQSFAENVDLGKVKAVCEFAVAGCMPDHIFILDVSVTEILNRLNSRGGKMNHYDKKPVEFHENLRRGYQWCAKRYKDIVTVVDGEKTPEEVFQVISQRTLGLLQ